MDPDRVWIGKYLKFLIQNAGQSKPLLSHPVTQYQVTPLGAASIEDKKIVIKKEDAEGQCDFMDVAANIKRFPETDLVLNYDDFNLQTIFEYIQITHFEIDPFMLDKFWQNLREDRCITVDASTIEWLGYDQEQERNRKQTFLKLLDAHTINYTQIKHDDPSFQNYPDLVDEASLLSET